MATNKTFSSVKVKRTHKVLNLQERLELIKLNEQGMSNAEIGRKLGIPRTTVSTIVMNKTKVLNEIKNSAPMHTKVIRKRANLIADMEKVLNVWIQDQISNNIPLSTNIIQAKAKGLFNKMKAEKGETAAEETFEASKGWFHRFKRRSNLYNINSQPKEEATNIETTEVPEIYPLELEKIIDERGYTKQQILNATAEMYPAELEKIIDVGGYTRQQIFNVDETALYWKKMPAKTFIAKEEKFGTGFKASIDRLTLLLGANAAGDCKLKPMLIYHSENPRPLKNYLKCSLPVYYKSNAKALMTADLFATWFSDYFKPTVEAYCREQNIPFNILLLVDNASVHPRALTESFKEIQVAFMPPLLQPMEQGVISAFKSYYLRSIFAKAIVAVDHDLSEESNQNKLKSFWNRFTILDGIKTIRDAWNEVSETILKGVWRNLIPTLMDDFEDFEDPVEKITSNVVVMARELELELQHEDVAELLESHNEILTDVDLLLMEQQRRLFREQEALSDDTVQPRVLTTKELKEGIAKIEELTAFWERVDPNFERSSKVNNGLQNQIACYRELLRERQNTSKRQTSLLSYFTTSPSQASTDTLSDPKPSTSTRTRAALKSSPAKRMRLFEGSEELLSPSDFLQ